MGKGGKGFDSVVRGNKWDNALFGTSGKDKIEGRGGNDTLDGAAGNDLLDGGTGNDTILAGLGDDTIIGGDGGDTVVFSGDRSDYTVTQIDATTVEITGPDGTDTISGVETFEFGDVTQTFAEVILPWLPNLTASGLIASTTAAVEGETISIDWIVGSNGNAGADSSITNLVVATAPDMASVINVFGSATTGPLASGESISLSGSFLTEGLGAGTYYIAAVADSGGSLAESDETDNVTDWIAITVEAQEKNLTASGLIAETPTTVVEGDLLSFEWMIGANGNTTIDDSTTNLVFASAPDMGNVIEVFGSAATGLMADGDSLAFSGSVWTGGFAPGTYYVAAVADSGNEVAETDETDNVTDWIAVTIEPRVNDYGLESVEVLPSSDFDLGYDPYGYYGPGARLDISTTVANRGNTGSNSFTLQTYLSTDQVLSQDDYDIGYEQVYVPFGETVVNTNSYDVYEYFPSGDYYVISVIYEDYATYPWDDDSDNIFITASPITLVGGWTYGTEGDDVFTGTEAAEFFEGYGGNDTLLNAGTDDVFIGGDGIDFADYSSLGNGVGIYWDNYASPNTGLFVESIDPYGYGGYQEQGFLDSVERVVGTSFDDELYIVNGSVNEIATGEGNDTILGSVGDDVIDAGNGDDLIGGLFGDDLITAGDGFDTLLVERKSDGLGGYDGHGHDVVTDFDPFMDLLLIEIDNGTTYDPFSDLADTAEGALLTLSEDSSVLLQGVSTADLNGMNVGTVEEYYGVYV